MGEQKIVMIVITIIGVAFLIHGVYALIKGEIKVIFGRRNRSTVTFTGTAGDIVAGMSVLGGAATSIAALVYWLGALSFEIGFIVAIASVLLYQLVAFIMKLTR